MESLVQCLEGWLFSCSRKLYILFSISFLIFWNSINLAYEYHSLETRIWFLIIFLPLKESLTLFQVWVFCYIFNYFVLFRVIENRFAKINFKYFNVNYDCSSWLVDQFYFYMHRPIKAWLFKKNILRVVYLCIFI